MYFDSHRTQWRSCLQVNTKKNKNFGLRLIKIFNKIIIKDYVNSLDYIV